MYDTNCGMGDLNAPTTNNEVFTRHNDSVLCCSIDNRTRVAVSGGIDDTAFVWDLTTKHVIFECEGHKESVVAAAFSVNSTYVATGDLNGYIQVRNTTTGIQIFEYEIDEINWIIWHNTSDFVLLAGTTKGDFWMWNVNDPAAVKTFPSYGFSTTTARLLNDGMKIVSAYADGSIRVFDLKSGQAIFLLGDPSQAETISIDLNPNNALLAVGCIDSRVKLINLHAGKLVGSLSCKSPNDKPAATSDPRGGETSIDSVQRSEADQSGTSMVKLTTEHDESDDTCIPTNSEPLEVIDEYSASCSKEGGEEIDHDVDDDTDFLEGGEEGDEEDEGESAPIESVESVLFSPCGNYLAASNNSGSIYIWDVASQMARCELHTGIGITRCAWSEDGSYITGCLDGAVRIYDLNLNKLSETVLHSDQILDIAYKNKVIVTASEDKTCRAIGLMK